MIVMESDLYRIIYKENMAARITIGTSCIDVNDGVTIEAAMISAGKHPDAFLFFLNGRPVPMTTVLTDGMAVETLRVASGG
jgi:sulfur carrier protein